MNRRELLKYFAAGTVIAPLGGSVAAKLVEPPKIVPYGLTEIIKPSEVINCSRIIEASVTLAGDDGQRHTVNVPVKCDGLIYPGSEIRITVQAGRSLYASPVLQDGWIEGEGKL